MDMAGSPCVTQYQIRIAITKVLAPSPEALTSGGVRSGPRRRWREFLLRDIQ